MLKVNGVLLDDIIKIKSINIIEPIKKLIKNSTLAYWTYREIRGQIIVNASIEGENDEDIGSKLDILMDCLGSGIIQIDNKHYKVNLIMNVGSNIDTNNFYIAFLFKEENVGTGIMPLAIKDVKATVVGKNVTLSFKKGIDSVKTKIVCNGKEIITEDSHIEIVMDNNNTLYEAELYSISSTENLGSKVTVSFKSDRAIIIPSIPQDVEVTSIRGKEINVSFKKGENAFKTEIDVSGEVYVAYDENVDIVLPEYNKEYDVKLRSLSIDGNESLYTEIIKVSTGMPIIPKVPTIDDVIINEDIVTIQFTNGENAAYTEFIIDGHTYIVKENILTVPIGEYEKEFIYKARSISSTDEFSDYTEEYKATTGRKVIIPKKPFEITVNSVIGKSIKVTFANGENAETTEAIIDDVLVTSNDNEIEIIAPNFNTAYKLKLRSKSVTLDTSEWTDEIDVITKEEPKKALAPTVGVIEVNGRAIKIPFTKGKDSKYTELQINDDVYSTELEVFEVVVAEGNKEYTAILKSISEGYGVGDAIEVKFTSGEVIVNSKILGNDDSYSPLQNENINSKSKGFINEVDIDLKSLAENSTNRYSINASVKDGKIQ